MEAESKLGGRYKLVSKFTDGSLLRITALDINSDDKKVGIVALTDSALQNPRVLEWFKRQSNHLSTFNHRNIVSFIDATEPGVLFNSPAIITESLDSTLHDYLSKQKLKTDAVRYLTEELLAGLRVIHERDILHLDVHPKTVGVSADGRVVKFMDLGNCTAVSDGNVSLEPNPKYCAPENYKSEESLGHFSDLYSVGMIAYEALLGTQVFSRQFAQIESENNEQDRARKWVNWHVSADEIRPPHTLRTEVSRDFSNRVVNLLQKDISKRIDSVTTAGAQSNSGESKVNNGKTGQFPDEPSPWRMPVLWGGGLAGLCLIAVLGFLFFSVEPKEPVAQVDTDEINRLVDRSTHQKALIENLKFEETSVYDSAERELGLATDAYSSNDMAEMLVRMQNAVGLYDEHIRNEGGVVLEERGTLLENLSRKATAVGTVSLDAVPDGLTSSEYTSLDGLEQKVETLNVLIAQYEEGILKNNREVTLGSTEDQINSALDACRRYTKGCEREWYADELQRTVLISPFLMDPREVSVAEFADYVVEFSVSTEAERRGFSTKVVPSAGFAVAKVEGLSWNTAYTEVDKALPVVHVTRADASGYCESRGRRLPTEDEWEYAARGKEMNNYPWGMDWNKDKLYWGRTNADSVLPVGSFPPSETGLYDLAGSVSEWTSTPGSTDGTAMIKGGSRFDTNVASLRLAVRRMEPVDYSGEDVGFRCAESSQDWPDVTAQ